MLSKLPANNPLPSQSMAGPNALVALLKKKGSFSSDVLGAFAQVPRHRYIDSALAMQAYTDNALPIGHQQTISQPSVIATMLSALLPENNSLSNTVSQQTLTVARHFVSFRLSNVLEIGTGCGYQAHLLSLIATQVYSIERIEALYRTARRNVMPFRLANLRLILGDGYLGLPQIAAQQAFDGIIMAAACERPPEALLQQLQIGGRLVAPIYTAKGQQIECWQRKSARQWASNVIQPCHFVPMRPGIEK